MPGFANACVGKITGIKASQYPKDRREGRATLEHFIGLWPVAWQRWQWQRFEKQYELNASNDRYVTYCKYVGN
jgi:hypothetical protein